MPSLIDSLEPLDWNELIVVMAFKIPKARSGRQPLDLYHFAVESLAVLGHSNHMTPVLDLPDSWGNLLGLNLGDATQG
jgi:hypothetical protein